MITIIARRSLATNSRSTSWFETRVEGEGATLCISHHPFLDGARELIERGYDPGELLVMHHEGADTVCLSAPLAVAAKLTVNEGNERGPRFKPWKPFSSGAVAARIGANDEAASSVAACTKKSKLARAA
jgi:hypothetical protein